MSEEMKIILINSVVYIFIFSGLIYLLDDRDDNRGLMGKTNKLLSTILLLILAGLFYVIFKSALDSHKNTYTVEKHKVSEVKSLIKRDLKEDIISRKCEIFLSEHKDDNMPKYICNKEAKDNAHDPISYKISAGTKITVLVKDGFMYKYTESDIKNNKLINKILRYSFISLDPDTRRIIDWNIKNPKIGFTYLDMFNEINREVNLCESYDYFTDIVDCGIKFKVVPDDELPAGKIYKVE